MALNPKFSGHRFGPPGGHTIEFWVDYVCPFSKKFFDTLYKVPTPITLDNSGHPSNLENGSSERLFHLPPPNPALASFLDNDS